MSIQAVAWVLDQDIADAKAKLVLISLANALNGKTGRCFPSFEQIMKESSNSRSTVIRKLKWLEDNNWVSIHREFAQDGRQMANSYSLKYEGVSMTRGGVTLTPEGFTGDTGVGVNCDTPYKEPEEIPEENKSNTNVLPKKSRKQSQDKIFEDEFSQAFWPRYPTKTDKKKSLVAFIKARKQTPLDEIMEGLERYIATKPTDRQWMNPTTFLNGERWQDQPAITDNRNAGNRNNQQPSKIEQIRDAHQKLFARKSNTEFASQDFGRENGDEQRQGGVISRFQARQRIDARGAQLFGDDDTQSRVIDLKPIR